MLASLSSHLYDSGQYSTLIFWTVQSLSHIRLFVTPWTAACQASLSTINSQSLLKLMSIQLVMPSNHLILCHPLLLLLQFFPASGFFPMSLLLASCGQSNGFSFSISPSNEYSGLISFRMDRLDLLAVQGTLKSLLQHHSSKASILWCSVFFTVQLSHSYMTAGKTIPLTRRIFVGKAMSLFFNMLSRLVIAFLPRSKCLLISWLQSPSAVILEPPENKLCHCFHCFPIYLPQSNGTGAEVQQLQRDGTCRSVAKRSYPSPKVMGGKKGKWLSEEALQIAVKRREAKSKGEKERSSHLNAEFQRIARRDKKAFLSDQCKKHRKTTEWERIEISSRKLEIPREHFMQRWDQ